MRIRFSGLSARVPSIKSVPWIGMTAVLLSSILCGCTGADLKRLERAWDIVAKNESDGRGTPTPPPSPQQQQVAPPPQVPAPAQQESVPTPPPPPGRRKDAAGPRPASPGERKVASLPPAVEPVQPRTCEQRLQSFTDNYALFIRGRLSSGFTPGALRTEADGLWSQCPPSESRALAAFSKSRAMILFFAADYPSARDAMETAEHLSANAYGGQPSWVLTTFRKILTYCASETDALDALRVAQSVYQGNDYRESRPLFEVIATRYAKQCRSLGDYANQQIANIR